MVKKCMLTNRKLAALRRDPVYQTVIVDLYLLGALDKSIAEQLVGAIPDHLKSVVDDDSTSAT